MNIFLNKYNQNRAPLTYVAPLLLNFRKIFAKTSKKAAMCLQMRAQNQSNCGIS